MEIEEASTGSSQDTADVSYAQVTQLQTFATSPVDKLRSSAEVFLDESNKWPLFSIVTAFQDSILSKLDLV